MQKQESIVTREKLEQICQELSNANIQKQTKQSPTERLRQICNSNKRTVYGTGARTGYHEA